MKATIPLVEVTSEIRNGVSDAELMKKYRLSEDGLKRLFDELVKAVSHRSSTPRWNLRDDHPDCLG